MSGKDERPQELYAYELDTNKLDQIIAGIVMPCVDMKSRGEVLAHAIAAVNALAEMMNVRVDASWMESEGNKNAPKPSDASANAKENNAQGENAQGRSAEANAPANAQAKTVARPYVTQTPKGASRDN